MARAQPISNWQTPPAWGSEKKYPFPKGWSATVGPILSVNDAATATAGGPQVAEYMANGYIERPGTAVGVRTRPGFCRSSTYLGTTPLASLVGSQTAPVIPQAIIAYPVPGYAPAFGTYLVIVGGHLFIGPFEQATEPGYYGTDISPSGITIDPSALTIYTAWFANGLVVSDGINPPWWVSTFNLEVAAQTGAALLGATIIDLGPTGNAVNAIGPPAIYYGCLFFIQPGNATLTEYDQRIVWSEPSQPTTGYMMTIDGFTYTNFRSLAEAGALSLTALVAENEALYYFRKSSIGTITGQVGSDFASSGVQDSISQTVGCTIPATIVKVDADIFFMDEYGKPWRLVKGGSLVPLWGPALSTLYNTSSIALSAGTQLVYPPGAQVVGGAYSHDLQVVVWSVNEGNNPTSDQLLVFDVNTNGFMGAWFETGVNPDPGNVGLNTFRALTTGISGQIVWMNTAGHLLCQFPRGYDPGVDYTAILSTGSLGMSTIPLAIGFTPAGDDILNDKIFDRVDMAVLGNPIYNAGEQLTFSVGYVTNRGSVSPIHTLILQFQTGGSPGTISQRTQHVAFGLNGFGRSLSLLAVLNPVVLTNGGPAVNLLESQPFTIVDATLRGWLTNDAPSIP